MQDQVKLCVAQAIIKLCVAQAIMGAKGKCEQEMNALGQDIDEMATEARMSEEKAQRTMVDAARQDS